MDYYKAFNPVAVLTYEKNLKNVENIINAKKVENRHFFKNIVNN